ncbi:hypothetical protein DP116_17655 [Brasilonema bromeliae SPC951]|uniref:Uncharacterized protein n=2 Tax=Bromeliae group (in: Brasilonema) TaxID=3398495 RepID=A0ABX1P9S2_9CYAN|nr:hypothetical protein [Brasilonema bromeliae SPC951]
MSPALREGNPGAGDWRTRKGLGGFPHERLAYLLRRRCANAFGVRSAHTRRVQDLSLNKYTTMQPDLQSLYITQDDLKQIAGLSRRDLKADETLKYPRKARLLLLGAYTEQILFFGWGLIPIAYLIKWRFFRERQRNILRQIDDYNAVLKAIDINDQLEAAGNQGVSLTDREKVIDVLKTTRSNLICALKTERILRKNKEFIARNMELLESNVTAMQGIKVNHEAREYARRVDEALKIAQDVQVEMRKLEEE